MALIRCGEDHLAVAAAEFPCQIVDFSIKYLGILLSVTKLPWVVFQSLVDQAANRLSTWKGRLLRHNGRLTLIKTTLQAIPNYVSISLQLPPWVAKALEKIFKVFLWTGSEVDEGGKCLVAWVRVQRLIHLGGLGVLDLRLMGIALCVWWLQRAEMDRSCSSLPMTADQRTKVFFSASTVFVLGDGVGFKFWTNPWIQGINIRDLAPDLWAAVPAIDDGVVWWPRGWRITLWFMTSVERLWCRF
jgi:hypothetical protein